MAPSTPAPAAAQGGSGPKILITSHPLSGHLMPMVRIAAALVGRGLRVFFLGPTAHRARIEATGARFLPLAGRADLDDRRYYQEPPSPDYPGLPWHERVLVDMRLQILEAIPAQWQSFVSALQLMHRHQEDGRDQEEEEEEEERGQGEEHGQEYERDPEAPVLVVCEAFFYGILPMFHGAGLPAGVPRWPRSVCVSVTIPAVRSADLPPLGYPFPFDASPGGRARNSRLWDRSWAPRARPLSALLDDKMREAGAAEGVAEVLFGGANYLCHDRILQTGVPGLEYPRGDWPSHFRFVGLAQGGATRRANDAARPRFEWWHELEANSALSPRNPRRRKVVVVAQGTVETRPRDLIVPTIEALGTRPDVLVVAILGWKDAELSELTAIPGNVRVADYLSYDLALAHADVWVHNAGFGALSHGIANAVPMVAAGEGMDKGENAARIAWSGVGVDLQSGKPTAEQVREGIDRVLLNESYAQRVKELRAQSDSLDSFEIIYTELLQLASKAP